jgi:3-hydroxy-9,10-secoandrosta-1,3,5(10)-triene-9,17-dione monooxygenase reductase component
MQVGAVHDSPVDSLEPSDFRHTMACFATGVTVVTSAGETPPCGVTVNAFTAVSLAPALVLVCLGVASSTARAIGHNGVFAVNVLNADQEWLAGWFASRARGGDAFRRVLHRPAATGAPILDGVAAWLDCRVVDRHPSGDHWIVIGEVADLNRSSAGEPLVFHRGRYRTLRDRGAKPPRVLPTRSKQKGGDEMKKFSVRKLETVKTTAALYGALPCVLA